MSTIFLRKYKQQNVLTNLSIDNILMCMNIQYTIAGLRKTGLTQTQIGAAIGLGQPAISDMESGKSGTKRPSFAVVSALQMLAASHCVPTDPPATRRGKPNVVSSICDTELTKRDLAAPRQEPKRKI